MNYTEGLFRFIEKSPTPFHVIDNMKQELEEQGYKQILEREEWKLEHGRQILRDPQWFRDGRIPVFLRGHLAASRLWQATVMRHA